MDGYPTKISFIIKDAFSDEEGSDRDGYSVYIADPEYDIAKMDDPDAIVTPAIINIRFTYPLSRSVTAEFSNGPYSRAELARIICKKYQDIYHEEDETTQTNRNHTEGRYGIWGHVIEDLALVSVTKTGPFYSLGVDS